MAACATAQHFLFQHDRLTFCRISKAWGETPLFEDHQLVAVHQRTLGQRGKQAVALEHLARFAAGKFHLIGGERRAAAGEQMARKVFDVDDVAGLETTFDAGQRPRKAGICHAR